MRQSMPMEVRSNMPSTLAHEIEQETQLLYADKLSWPEFSARTYWRISRGILRSTRESMKSRYSFVN